MGGDDHLLTIIFRVAPAPSQAVGAGSSLIANEHLRTGEASSAQLLFLDETSVSMGAQSDLVARSLCLQS